ncbi:MAG TPA: hypothetical protein VFZ91_07075 [Allosphingosinicella sp.]
MNCRKRYLWTILIASCLGSAPARAQQDETGELERLVSASAELEPGLAFARNQAASGDLLGALATLERVLIAYPNADDARLYHAALLCRLDDRGGARAELVELAGRPISDPGWSEVEAACGTLPRPGPSGGAR